MENDILVTGGCGFIGSHIIGKLVELGGEVVVFDNLSKTGADGIRISESKLRLVEGDLLNSAGLDEVVRDCGLVFHFAANPQANIGYEDPGVDFQQNIVATRNLLEAMRKSRRAKMLVFASTSTVYGDAVRIPTPEDYGPLLPVSLYGASKLCCEALISGYANLFGIRSVIYRFANVVGPGGHGVIQDLIHKLEENPGELEIMGDGSQTKSYMYIDDCVDAILFGLGHSPNLVNVYNIGSEDQIDVRSIAETVIEEMGLSKVRVHYTGGVDGGRGWKGDVKNMRLDIGKILKVGWKPTYNSEESIRLAIRAELRRRDRFR